MKMNMYVLEVDYIEFRRDMEGIDLNISIGSRSIACELLKGIAKTINSHHHSQVHIDTVTRSKMMN